MYTNQKTSWLVHSWSLFGAWMSFRKTWTHKTHHSLNLGEDTTFSFIVFFVLGHRAYTQMSFCPKTPKLGVLNFLKLGFMQFWRLIISCVDLQLRWSLKQSCSPCQELSNDMCHATCTQLNQGDSWLLVVRNKIGNLTFDLFFWP
jgi:hypothetical protein